MSWGYKIILVYGLFVCGIVYLVIRSSRENIDLVTKDYYAEELKFQHKIDEQANVSKLSAPVTTVYRNDTLTLFFPDEFIKKPIKGTLVVYYPADKHKDISAGFETDKAACSIKMPWELYGQHEVHVAWNAAGVDYYFEKKIFF